MNQFETDTHTAVLPAQVDDRPRTLFMSDCHLCADESPDDLRRQERVLGFLATIDPESTALYIVGDLFDFWFAYRRSIPARGFAVLARLLDLRQRGLPITFIAGNHDFWGLEFFEREIGMETFDQPLGRTIGGQRVWMAHGDGLGSGDHGYKMLRHVFRHPLSIAAYRLIHPDLGIRLATAWSRLSRHQGDSDELPHIERTFNEVAHPAFADGYDIVILGHMHLPVLEQHGAHTMIVLGDWITHFTYLSLEGHRLELRTFAEDGSSAIVVARDLATGEGRDPQTGGAATRATEAARAVKSER